MARASRLERGLQVATLFAAIGVAALYGKDKLVPLVFPSEPDGRTLDFSEAGVGMMDGKMPTLEELRWSIPLVEEIRGEAKACRHGNLATSCIVINGIHYAEGLLTFKSESIQTNKSRFRLAKNGQYYTIIFVP